MVDVLASEKRLLKSLYENWQFFSETLASVSHHPRFDDFLSEYRGHSDAHSAREFEPLGGSTLSQWREFFITCFNRAALSQDCCSEELLKKFESSLNIALYYWMGSNDRNFQFRTVVHFLEIEDAEVDCTFTSGLFTFCVNEWGFSFSQRQIFEIFPRRHSLARVCGLSSYYEAELKPLPRDHDLFAVIRTVQREFCLLIDEWEHCNSILAVKQFALRKFIQSEPEQGRSTLGKIVAVRNALAHWCVQSTADFQRFVARVEAEKALHTDVRAELKALDALLLSGFQKFLLPASVSRHIYTNDVILECLRWTSARLQTHSDDLFSQMSSLVFRVALNQKVSADALCDLVLGKSFQWTLSADPSAAIKAVSWGLTPFEHRFFSLVLSALLDAKVAPNALDSHWLQTLASVVEMPATFQVPVKDISDLSLAPQEMERLHARAVAAIEKSCEQSRDEALKAALFVLEFFRSEVCVAEGSSDRGGAN